MPSEVESSQGNHLGRGRGERSSQPMPKAWVRGTSRMSPIWSGVGMGSRRSEAEGRSSHSKISVPNGRKTPRKTRMPSQIRSAKERLGRISLAGFVGSGPRAARSGDEGVVEVADGADAAASASVPRRSGASSSPGSIWARMRRRSASVTMLSCSASASRSTWSRRSATTSSASAPSAANRARCWSSELWSAARAVWVQVVMVGLRLGGRSAGGFQGTRSWSPGCEVLRG